MILNRCFQMYTEKGICYLFCYSFTSPPCPGTISNDLVHPLASTYLMVATLPKFTASTKSHTVHKTWCQRLGTEGQKHRAVPAVWAPGLVGRQVMEHSITGVDIKGAAETKAERSSLSARESPVTESAPLTNASLP